MRGRCEGGGVMEEQKGRKMRERTEEDEEIRELDLYSAARDRLPRS
jgi:hypothetical protein